MPLDLDYTPRGRETLMRRLRRLGFASVLLAGLSIVVSIVTIMWWGVSRLSQVFLCLLAPWFIALGIYAFRRMWGVMRKTIERLARVAAIDEASGSFDSLYLRLRLDEEEDRSKRYGGVTGLLFIDVDGLDEVVGRFGREVEDAVLESLTGVMSAGLRQCDVLGRLREDEFLAILPETDRRNAHPVAERLRSSVEEFSYDCPGGGKVDFIRLSIGIAAFPINGDTMRGVAAAARSAANDVENRGGNDVGVTDQFIRTDEIEQHLVEAVRGEEHQSG